MKILEKGMDIKEQASYTCDCDGKGVSKCKGCEDINNSIEQVKEIYENQ